MAGFQLSINGRFWVSTEAGSCGLSAAWCRRNGLGRGRSVLETLAELCDDHARKARDNSRASGAIEFVRFRLWKYAIHRSRCQAGRLVVGHTRRGHGCGSHGLLSSSGDTAREPCRLALCSQALNIDALEDPYAALGSLG